MSVTDNATALADWIAEVLESTAGWRAEKADQFPDDTRNLASASALYAAAKYVRELEDPLKSPGVRAFEDFAEMLDDGIGRYDTSPEIIVSSGPRTARYGFHRGLEPDHEKALSALYDDSLENWTEYMNDAGPGVNQPPGDLVRWFEDEGFPIWQDEEEDA